VKTENRDWSVVAHGNWEDVLWNSSRMNLIMIYYQAWIIEEHLEHTKARIQLVKWIKNSENMPYTSTSITLMFIALLCDVGLGSHQENAENNKWNENGDETKHLNMT